MDERDFLVLAAKVDNNSKDIAQMSVLFEKMDATIEKLTDLTANVAKLLAVHEERLEHHQKMTDDTVGLLENRRKETDEKINDIYEHIEREIEKVKEDEIRPVKDQVDDLRKMAWSFGGGGLVVGSIIGWVATHWDGLSKTLKTIQ